MLTKKPAKVSADSEMGGHCVLLASLIDSKLLAVCECVPHTPSANLDYETNKVQGSFQVKKEMFTNDIAGSV